MKLSQSVTYAIHALLRLAGTHSGVPVSCGKLAEQGKMPERFLLQILRDLSKQGLLQSTRGGGGGFTLGRSPEQITLLEVLEAVDGPLAAGMPVKGAFPPAIGDRLQQELDRIAEATRNQLQAIKLSDLLSESSEVEVIADSAASSSL